MGRKCVSEKILPKGRILYFNEEEHKYTDDLGNGYISVTTLIKTCNGYKLNANGFINDRIYTIDDIIGSHKYGKLNLEYFVKTGIREKYPDIFSLIAALVTKGYHIYAEIGVYDSQNLVSGLIDILLIRNKEFIILDWKTNKAPIRFESGYYDKKLDGTLDLNNFIYSLSY